MNYMLVIKPIKFYAALIEDVNKLILEGWQPLGAPLERRVEYVQALWKPPGTKPVLSRNTKKPSPEA